LILWIKNLDLVKPMLWCSKTMLQVLLFILHCQILSIEKYFVFLNVLLDSFCDKLIESIEVNLIILFEQNFAIWRVKLLMLKIVHQLQLAFKAIITLSRHFVKIFIFRIVGLCAQRFCGIEIKVRENHFIDK